VSTAQLRVDVATRFTINAGASREGADPPLWRGEKLVNLVLVAPTQTGLVLRIL
jgi:hypothetical protein